MSATDNPGSVGDIHRVLPPDAPGLVAVLNNRADFDRAEAEHWYRIPVQSAPDDLRKIRWVAFYLTKVFGREKWSVRHWAKVRKITKARRVELLPQQERHPRAQNLYYRLELGALQTRPEPILSRRRRLIVFIPSIWKKFTTALEINDLVHGSPLEDRLWAAFKQVEIEAERQWWEFDRKTRYCLDFALFCPERNIDVECDGDTWHIKPEAAAHDNARNNFMEQRGWHVLRF
ncbi:MAG: endonuclease domain-containing protein, partial [Gemmataceae bacterium]|nr:endonuclease domain-containing protein [Gemmataceae bacterium]